VNVALWETSHNKKRIDLTRKPRALHYGETSLSHYGKRHIMGNLVSLVEPRVAIFETIMQRAVTPRPSSATAMATATETPPKPETGA
ncbi:MAG: hypothetical protein O7D30_06585, partial [Rickettsia endosymbiont of Ixodes persulcatus]|nr:hypothetical protein [Rickettsia endosymbiont of Ixodes persulcatus]